MLGNNRNPTPAIVFYDYKEAKKVVKLGGRDIVTHQENVTEMQKQQKRLYDQGESPALVAILGSIIKSRKRWNREQIVTNKTQYTDSNLQQKPQQNWQVEKKKVKTKERPQLRATTKNPYSRMNHQMMTEPDTKNFYRT